jgi:organic radical activating enzyme
MNKRIEELTEQATKYFPKTETSGEYWTFDKQKFAELIIRECGEIAYKAYWDNPETVRGIHIKEKIKKHFGVK